MKVSVSHPKPGVFTISVKSACHCHDYDRDVNTMDEAWREARKVSEAEADYHTKLSRGWGA